VHTQCLTQWQVQLAAARGPAGAARCDVCKHGWKPAYRGLGAAACPPQRGLVGSALRAATALAPHAATVLSWWRIVAVAQGVLSAMEAGALGWRLGLRYSGAAATEALRSGGGTVVHWAPFSVWAVNQVPPMHLPVTLAMYLAASSSTALQGLITGAAGLYAGAVSGFAHGVVLTSLQTLKILGGGAHGVARGAKAVLRLLGVLAAAMLGRC
jgi:hypothetical protein